MKVIAARWWLCLVIPRREIAHYTLVQRPYWLEVRIAPWQGHGRRHWWGYTARWQQNPVERIEKELARR